MTAFYTYLSTLTLNVNGFYSPIKSHRIAGRVRNKLHLSVVYKKFSFNNKYHLTGRE